MSEIKELMGMNIAEIIFGLFVFLVCFKIIAELFDWLVSRIKTKFKNNETQMSDHDLLIAHTKELEEQNAEIKKLGDSLSVVVQKLDDMKERDDSSQRRKLKDRIAQAYRVYHEKKQWTYMEKDAFMGLVEDYESHGGENSFVHETCLPESYTWKIVEQK